MTTLTTATTVNTINTVKTANYLLTFNNDALASAKDLVTGRFVKRSTAMTEYESELAVVREATKLVVNGAATTVVLKASKIILSATVMTALTMLFVLTFAGLFFAFFAASSGNIYVKSFLMLFIAFVSSGGIYLIIADKLIDVKKQIQATC